MAAYHGRLGGQTVSQHPLICCFIKGTRRFLPVSVLLVPLWDLAVVLEELKGRLFEQLQGADLKFVSLETMLLLALALAKCLSDIHVLSGNPSCSLFSSGDIRIILKTNFWA